MYSTSSRSTANDKRGRTKSIIQYAGKRLCLFNQVMGRVKKALILRWKLLNPPQNLLKILPMITGTLHRLNTSPFSLSGRLSHFRAFSQIFDTGFSRLSPFSLFPSHHFPLALYARSIIPISRFSRFSRTQEFPNPHLDLETPVEEAVQRRPHCLTNVS